MPAHSRPPQRPAARADTAALLPPALPPPFLPPAALPPAVCIAAAALALVPAFAPPARAQLLPDTGTTQQAGDLRQQIEGLLAPPTGLPGPQGWTFTPGLTIEESWTDHLQGLGGSGNSAFITTLTPSLLINGQTSRSNTIIIYNPSLFYYSNNGSQNRINQNLNAVSQLTLVPELLFLDLRGFANTLPVTSGYGPSGTVALTRQAETQNMSFSVHPYLRERFGDLGALELGGTLSLSSQNTQGYGATGLPLAGTSGSGQTLLSQQEYLSVTSGPDLGRTSVALSASASQSTGSGGINNSNRAETTLTLGYAVAHGVVLLASLGYDSIHYDGTTTYGPGGTEPYNQSGINWSGGLRWQPNPDSSIVMTYGHRYGASAAGLDATYAPTARTRIYARYSQGIASGLEQLLTAMNESTLDPLGNPIAVNGTPLQIASSFYGIQDYLARVSNASLTAVLLQDRNAFSASFSYQERQPLATGTSTVAPPASTGYYATLTWQRDLWPDLQGFLFAQWGSTQYGQNSLSNGISATDSLVVSLRLVYSISPTLSTYAQYSWSSQNNQTLYGFASAWSGNQPTNLFLIGVHKTF